MSDFLKAKPSSRSRIAWVTGILCVACCAVPFVGVAMGSATLAAFVFYWEGAAIAFAILGVAWVVYALISRREASSCCLNCGQRLKPGKGDQLKKD